MSRLGSPLIILAALTEQIARDSIVIGVLENQRNGCFNAVINQAILDDAGKRQHPQPTTAR